MADPMLTPNEDLHCPQLLAQGSGHGVRRVPQAELSLCLCSASHCPRVWMWDSSLEGLSVFYFGGFSLTGVLKDKGSVLSQLCSQP